MGWIRMTSDQIETEHICCALGTKSYERAVAEKKQWLKDRMDEGLVFYRLDERAKVFIEYMPAEKAWVPICAPNFMYVHCLWVSGRHQNNGYAKQLLDYCKNDAIERGMDGIVHIVSNKKLPFLSDKTFFEHMGFEAVDRAEPYFQLMALRWNERAVVPTFNKRARLSTDDEGISVYYTAQCPFAVGVLEELSKVAAARNVPFQAHRMTKREEAQNGPTIWTTFGLFYDGKFVTHEIVSPNKFDRMLTRLIAEKG
ncbi:N-acetyltransferase [Cohnella massiliensis]|uniref:N-acetyltransferase n=1 Tax=Cohnella massiliensis TaxID=1816691 RepID=UPI0009B9FFAA|nr:N-acetyltransferase [Cohnella massiliensis]